MTGLTKGRRKIDIKYIAEKSRRHITFSKRKAGIVKKAHELATLTGTDVLLLIHSEAGTIYYHASDRFRHVVDGPDAKRHIADCLNATVSQTTNSAKNPTDYKFVRMNPPTVEQRPLSSSSARSSPNPAEHEEGSIGGSDGGEIIGCPLDGGATAGSSSGEICTRELPPTIFLHSHGFSGHQNPHGYHYHQQQPQSQQQQQQHHRQQHQQQQHHHQQHHQHQHQHQQQQHQHQQQQHQHQHYHRSHHESQLQDQLASSVDSAQRHVQRQQMETSNRLLQAHSPPYNHQPQLQVLHQFTNPQQQRYQQDHPQMRPIINAQSQIQQNAHRHQVSLPQTHLSHEDMQQKMNRPQQNFQPTPSSMIFSHHHAREEELHLNLNRKQNVNPNNRHHQLRPHSPPLQAKNQIHVPEQQAHQQQKQLQMSPHDFQRFQYQTVAGTGSSAISPESYRDSSRASPMVPNVLLAIQHEYPGFLKASESAPLSPTFPTSLATEEGLGNSKYPNSSAGMVPGPGTGPAANTSMNSILSPLSDGPCRPGFGGGSKAQIQYPGSPMSPQDNVLTSPYLCTQQNLRSGVLIQSNPGKNTAPYGNLPTFGIGRELDSPSSGALISEGQNQAHQADNALSSPASVPIQSTFAESGVGPSQLLSNLALHSAFYCQKNVVSGIGENAGALPANCNTLFFGGAHDDVSNHSQGQISSAVSPFSGPSGFRTQPLHVSAQLQAQQSNHRMLEQNLSQSPLQDSTPILKPSQLTNQIVQKQKQQQKQQNKHKSQCNVEPSQMMQSTWHGSQNLGSPYQYSFYCPTESGSDSMGRTSSESYGLSGARAAHSPHMVQSLSGSVGPGTGTNTISTIDQPLSINNGMVLPGCENSKNNDDYGTRYQACTQSDKSGATCESVAIFSNPQSSKPGNDAAGSKYDNNSFSEY